MERPTSNKLISIQNLKKETKTALVMDEVNLTVYKGEIFALVGAAGSGKTLISKIVLNLAVKTGGEVLIEGENNQKRFDKNIKKIGAVIDQQSFYRDKTGYKTLKHIAMINLRSVSHSRIVNTLNMVGLKSVMHRTLDRYNKSQIQRLKIAAALLTRPEILVLDEPFKDLNKEQANEIRVILKSLADKQGTAIFITAEKMTDVEEICDTVGIIDDGMMVVTKSYNEMIQNDAPYTKVSVMTSTPNLAAKIIDETLKYEVFLCGNYVIVNTNPQNAQKIADELGKNGVKILSMKRVNRSLQEQFLEIIRARRGAIDFSMAGGDIK